MPEQNPYRAGYLSQHASKFRIKYQKTGSIDDLDKAIRLGRAAINATDEDNSIRATILNDHGSGFVARYHTTGSADDLQEAFTQFTESLYDSSSPYRDCLIGELSATDIALMSQDYAQGAQFLTECLALLPSAIPRSGSNEDHLSILCLIFGLGSWAAAVFLRDGRSALESLQALEKTRGVISSLISDSRFDISKLQECRPVLWNQYCHVRRSIALSTLLESFNNDALLHRLGSSEPVTVLAAGVYTQATLSVSIMVKELDVLKAMIRKQPGFERFQLPLTDPELRGLARYGPIAIFNVTHIGSDALLITENDIQVLPLPQLTLRDLQE